MAIFVSDIFQEANKNLHKVIKIFKEKKKGIFS